MAKTELTIILPELAPILEQKINAGVIPKYLAKIISKSKFKPDQTGLSHLLFNHFSQEPQIGSDLPITHLETGDVSCLRADPCYLHADRDRLLLFSDDTTLTAQESDAFIAEIQPLFDDFGGRLERSQENNWLLYMKTMPDVNFSALTEVTGKGVESYLPTGKDSKEWLRLWNEVQMKLYASDINQRRAEKGLLPINSVWFWGAGTFTAKNKPWQKAQGQSTLLTQLANKSHSQLEENNTFSVSSLSAGKHLWLLDKLDLEGDWLQQLEHIDNTILQPLWQYCRHAKIAKIEVQIPNYGSYQLTSFDTWKFW